MTPPNLGHLLLLLDDAEGMRADALDTPVVTTVSVIAE